MRWNILNQSQINSCFAEKIFLLVLSNEQDTAMSIKKLTFIKKKNLCIKKINILFGKLTRWEASSSDTLTAYSSYYNLILLIKIWIFLTLIRASIPVVLFLFDLENRPRAFCVSIYCTANTRQRLLRRIVRARTVSPAMIRDDLNARSDVYSCSDQPCNGTLGKKCTEKRHRFRS